MTADPPAHAGPDGRRRLLLGVLLVVGLGLRLPGLAAPPLDFHATRQYFGATSALRFWEPPGSTPAAEAEALRAIAATQAPIEPPVLEIVTATGWRILGERSFWLPRLLSTLAWLAAAVAVHRLARMAAGERAALVGAAVFVILPYAIPASRAFQPEPLLVCAIAWSLVTTARWADRPDRRTLAWAAAVAAGAVFLKLTAVFFVIPPFAVAAAMQSARRRAVAATLAFTVAALTPAAAWNAFGIALGFLGPQVGGRILPSLLRTTFFWGGWTERLGLVFGWPLLAAAAYGFLLARRRPAGGVLIGSLVGYLAYSLSFTYHAATHDYYQLPFLPAVSVAAAVAVEHLTRRAQHLPRVQPIVIPVLLVTTALPLAAAPRLVVPPDRGRLIRDAVAIGRAVDHEPVVAVAHAYGHPLAFHGATLVQSWPSPDDERLDRLAGRPVPTVEQRLTDVRDAGVRWLVVTDLARWDRFELRLRTVVERDARLEARTDRYLIYDISGDG